jgi:hypothetical protein
MGFTIIEDKTLVIKNDCVNLYVCNRFFERQATNKTTMYSKYTHVYDQAKKRRFDKIKDEVALLIYFLVDHLV